MKNIPIKIQPTRFALKKYLYILLIVPLFSPALIPIVGVILIFSDLNPLIIGEIFDFMYFKPYLLIPSLLLYLFVFLSIAYVKITLQKIEKNLSGIGEKLYKKSTPDEILEISNEVYSIIRQKLLIIRFIPFIFSKGSSRAYISSIRQFIDSFIYQIIKDMYGDLAENLGNQKDTIRGARKSLTSLSGNPELESFAEAQSTRLDRQIEQFEELQRVLVKM